MRIYMTSWTTSRDTNMKLGVVQLMWGSLRLAPIIAECNMVRYCTSGLLLPREIQPTSVPRLGNTRIIQKWRHFLGNTCIAQEVASHFLGNTHNAQEVASLYGKYCDTSAMAVASIQHGSLV